MGFIRWGLTTCYQSTSLTAISINTSSREPRAEAVSTACGVRISAGSFGFSLRKTVGIYSSQAVAASRSKLLRTPQNTWELRKARFRLLLPTCHWKILRSCYDLLKNFNTASTDQHCPCPLPQANFKQSPSFWLVQQRAQSAPAVYPSHLEWQPWEKRVVISWWYCCHSKNQQIPHTIQKWRHRICVFVTSNICNPHTTKVAPQKLWHNFARYRTICIESHFWGSCSRALSHLAQGHWCPRAEAREGHRSQPFSAPRAWLHCHQLLVQTPCKPQMLGIPITRTLK